MMLTASIIAATAIVVLGVSTAAYLVERARRHSALGCIVEGLDQLASGNLVHRVVPASHETAELASAANRLAEAMQASKSDALRRKEAHTQLISNLSHDLRTPITSIAGYVDALQRGIGEDPARHLDIIATKTAELTRLADDLFYLTRLDAGDLSLKLMPVDVSEVARRSLLGFEHELRSRGIDVVVEIPDSTCEVAADEAALGRVIGNFVANSLKHARSMRRLGVAVDRDDDGCAVTVWDDGEGFPKGVTELLERGTSVGPGGGAGLGLSIAHELSARMGATVRVSSVAGERTSVTVLFPRTTPTPSTEENV
ncbi:MAG: HAMP domain-containing sensor histidine kinase [Actinomycetota bacterium]|nr:HAMP domain-containing sensor histidine kinase [Actinomycetota bacterium]